MQRILAFVLTLAFVATTAAAQEDPMEEQRCVWRCLANSAGASDPAYNACVERQCIAGGAPAAPAPQAKAAPSGGWVFGDNRQLGRSAYGQVRQGAIGLACGAGGWPLELRITKGLFQGPAMTLMFDDGGAVTVPAGSGGVTRKQGGACDFNVSSFRRASTLYLVDGAIKSIASDASGTIVTLQRKGKSVGARSAAEAYRTLGGVAVPLAGSSAAIDRLLASCPAARVDVAAGCGD